MSKLLAIVCAGAAIGWMVGLSHSPVVGAVITSVVGALVAGASALSDRREERFQLALWPTAALTCCIALTAPVGIVAREHGWFLPDVAPPPPSVGAPAPAPQVEAPKPAPARSGGLWAAQSTQCAGLGPKVPIRELQPLLQQSTSAALRALGKLTEETTVQAAVGELCP